MAQWPGIIERQLMNALNKKCASYGHFSKDSPEQLWVWQGQRRVSIKDTLGLDLPPVYGPPKARIILGSPDQPQAGQVWHVESELDVLTELFVQTPVTATPGQPTGYILELSDIPGRDHQKDFASQMTDIGLVGMSMPLRGLEKPNGPQELAEIYLGMDRCYAGAIATDLLRVLDHIEQQFAIEGEPIALVLSGMGIPIGMAYAAIDQRISALLIDLSTAPKSIITPTGTPPLFINQYIHLGPNPLLVFMQCCAPRPMTMVGLPEEARSTWLSDPRSGVLSFTDQLTYLEAAFQAAGNPERLKMIAPEAPKPSLQELIRQTLEPFYTSKE